ncbi:hypothetical protein BRC79_10425 [Halobacteriales archaeon QH_8_67_27]|nr:MAG: hypothetical protein BRC79_10425 [Halobacteriales archaeon QH_8_67_27]
MRADGTRFWASVTITAIRNDDDDLVGYAKVTRDMTERRAFERDLRRERDLLNSVFDAIPEGVAVLDAAGTPVRTNEQMRRYLEMDDEDDDPEPLADDAVRDEDGEPVPPGERPYDRAHRTGEPVRDWVGRFDLPGAREQWLSVTAVPLTDDEGAVERVVVSAEDVTQLKEQAERLQRSRESLERELDEVLKRIDDGFVAIDDDWRFTYVNEQAASLLDRPRSELVGRSIWDEFPEAVGTQFQAEYERAVETNESVFFEAYYPPLETWFGVSAHPSESGLSVYFRNVTERKERERELERYEAIVETVEDGIYVVDEDGYFTQVNEAYASMVGRSRETLVGKHVSAINPDEEALERVQDLEDTLASGETATASLEATLTRPDGSEWVGEAIFSLMETDDGYERVGVVRDVTERKERERELEQYEAVAATASDAIVTVDTSSTIRDVNPAVEDVFGYEPDELLGEPLTTLMPDELTADHFEAVDRYLATGERSAAAVAKGEREAAGIEIELIRSDGIRVPVETRYEPLSADGRSRCGVVRDISERLERERELQRRVRQQAVVTDLGQQALEGRDLDALMAEAAERVARTLDNDYCKVLDLNEDEAELLLRQGVGWDDGIVGEATVSTVEADSQAAYTLQSAGPVVVEDLTTETRFSGPDLLTDHDVGRNDPDDGDRTPTSRTGTDGPARTARSAQQPQRGRSGDDRCGPRTVYPRRDRSDSLRTPRGDRLLRVRLDRRGQHQLRDGRLPDRGERRRVSRRRADHGRPRGRTRLGTDRSRAPDRGGSGGPADTGGPALRAVERDGRVLRRLVVGGDPRRTPGNDLRRVERLLGATQRLRGARTGRPRATGRGGRARHRRHRPQAGVTERRGRRTRVRHPRPLRGAGPPEPAHGAVLVRGRRRRRRRRVPRLR